MRRNAVSIAVVGDSGVGKTTLLERLIPALEAHGLAVGAVKHASHGFVADRPGKDSYRLYEAGARAVALASVEQIATFRRVRPGGPHDPVLADALSQLPDDLDVVLIEGFAWEPVPRIVVVRDREAPRKELLARGSLVAIVRVSERLPDGRPLYRSGMVARLVEEVQRRVRRRGWLAEHDAAAATSGSAAPA